MSNVNQKRRPIRNKVRQMVLTISILAMEAVGVVALCAMLYMRKQSEKALTAQLTQNLLSVVKDKAALVDSELGKFAAYTSLLAERIHGSYEHGAAAGAKMVQPPQPAAEQAHYAMQRIIAGPDIPLSTLLPELQMLSRLEPLFTSIVEANRGIITSLHAATKSGLLIAYDKWTAPEADGSEVYYDFFSTDWFVQGSSHTGVYFTDVYKGGFELGYLVTCAAPFYDASGEVAGVVAIDMRIIDLYNAVVASAFDSSVELFLFDGLGRVVSQDVHKSVLAAYKLDERSVQLMLSESGGLIHSENDSYYAFYSIEKNGCKFCAHIPKRVLADKVRAMNESIIGTFIVFAVLVTLILVLVLYFSKRFSESLTRPLIQLRRDVKKISGGRFSYHAHVYANDEIGDLALSFNQMAFSLQRYVDYVTQMTKENERIHAELDVATKIQAYMLPSTFPAFPDRTDFDIYASMTPAKEVGGDFYDFFLIDSNHLAVVMGDVSGKGVPAALFMVNAKTLLKNSALMGGSPAEILGHVNNQLYELNSGGIFVTVWFGILELSSGLFTATNAGHECPAVCRADGRYELIQTEHCAPLAATDDLLFDEVEVTFAPGDRLCLYTDGAVEAKNASGEEFGTSRLLETLNAQPLATTQEQLQSLKSAIDGFVGKTPQYDDITLLSLAYFGAEKA